MRRVLGDAVISAAALLLLLTVLVSIDERVRERVYDLARPDSISSELTSVSSQVRRTASIVAVAAKDQSIEHAPLVIFAVAGTALVLAMLRL